MGRAIKQEARIDFLEVKFIDAEIKIEELEDRIDLLERAIQAGKKKPAKKHFEKARAKKDTLLEVIKEADNE